MFHEHAPRPRRTSRERCAITPQSAFLRLCRAPTERQQKCSLPQCVTTTHPAPERRTDPVYRRTFPAPLIPVQYCTSPEHSICDGPGLAGPCLRVPEAIIDSDEGRSPVPGLENRLGGSEEWTTSPGLTRLFPSRTRARLGTFIGVQYLA